MADVAVSGAGEVVYLTKNTAVATPAGQIVGVTDTAVLTPAGWTSTNHTAFKGRYMLVRVVESGAETDTVVTFKAGATGGTPANLAALGDMALPALAASSDQLIQIELSRFQQADGTVRVAVSGTATGSATFSVVNLSKGA
jgi:hypothetical protein